MEKPTYKRYPSLLDEIARKEADSHVMVALEKGEVVDLLKTVESVKRKLQALLSA